MIVDETRVPPAQAEDSHGRNDCPDASASGGA
jgi:hypothetical protein